MVFHKERLFTPEELAQYDGTDLSKPIYLAVLGRVYDVTAGREYYGPEGGYHFFSGKDGGRAFATGCFQTHLTPDVRGLTDQELQSILEWQQFYESSPKYFYIGKIHPPIQIDESTPIPEPCTPKEQG
ncbi:hypothetical protein HMI56_000340 [Coelomomyces lativittatus]|nr:hypothetical protein HMI56_000340 [Coelomomyces lativittatus]